HISNVRLVYTPEAVPGLYSVLEWEHVGSSWMDNENTTRYSGHDVANIKVNYDVNEMFTLYGKVNNVTDRLYAERAQLEFGEDYTPAAPRQVFVGLEVKL
ncbi:MAG TPA: TonB-dependent receptor, partial [Gammaproteobacteria bacterium]|nr:TonB-dependent receptor [Gammaproteobacteria bacterium]